jgi:hypothetical protein
MVTSCNFNRNKFLELDNMLNQFLMTHDNFLKQNVYRTNLMQFWKFLCAAHHNVLRIYSSTFTLNQEHSWVDVFMIKFLP